MKLRNLLAMSMVVATGLTLASCGGNKVYTGIGYNGSWDAAKNQLDLTAAYVAFDSKGVVVDARIDVVQVKVGLDLVNGGLTLLSKAEEGSVKTKLELGDAYGMVKYGGSISEVDTQIEAFADWTVGKTVAEVRAAIPEGAGHGTAVHADLTTSVTITVDAFISALQCAYENRTEATYDVVEGAQAGIALQSGLAYNYGKPTKELDVVVAGAMVKDGKVVAGTFDQVVYPVAIAEDGSLSGDTSSKYLTNGVLKSKKVLKDAYAMQPASKLEKGEWYQQAEVLDAAVVGLGQAEITALVAGEGTLAGCTMTTSSYLAAYAKAVKYAPLADVA